MPYTTGGLVANWTFHDLTTAGEIMDTVSANNLTAMHAAGVGFVADDPTLTLTVDENSSNGTLVGSIYGTDIDREVRITAMLAADSNLRYSAETGKFYKVVSTPVNWTTARDNALTTSLNGVNGQLVTIQSATENALVTSLWSIAGGDLWLGASDQTTEGTWRWQNGLSNGDEFWTGVSSGYRIGDRYTNWLPGQPDEANPPEDYARLINTGQWRDIGGSATYAYVVEWNADDVLDATNSVTYSITSQTVSGAFAINSDSGVITVANSGVLNFESQPNHTVTVRVTDGSGATFDKAFTISLSNVSVEPSNGVPSAPSTNEDTNLVFSSANGNAITVTDQNGSTNTLLQVSLSVPSGTLTLSQTTGLTFPGGSNGSGGMVIVGTESDINAALNGLTYAPVGNFNGNVNLVIETALAANMQGWYTFEGGNANDQSVGTTQNGTFVGNAATITDATRGTVLSLDGSGDSVSISSTFGSPTNVTIGGWVNLNVSTARAEFISLDNRVHISLDETTNGIKGSIQTGVSTWLDLTSERFIAGTGWHHVMYVFDDTNNVHNLYIDGQLAATAANANSIYWTGATTSYIGQHPTNSSWNLNGNVDDVRIYSRALSAAEVASIAAEQTVDSDTIAIAVTAVNDAPVLDSTRSPVLSPILEDATFPVGVVGTLVSSLIDFSSPSGQVDNVTDIDVGATLGIAISAVNNSNGSWFYSTDAGATWNAMGSVSQANARLLAADANTRIYFQPNADYAGTVTNAITFFAWDRSSGTNGGLVDLSDTTIADTFSTVSYSNNNGTANWSSSWVETDVDGGGASAGRILVRPTGDLEIRARATGNNIYREVNLTGATTASLSFNFVNTLTSGDTIVVQASSNGGSSYTTLGGGTFTSSLNAGTGTFSVDISSYIASNTRIRFFVSSIGGEDFLHVDDVQVTVTSGNRGGTSAFSLASDTAAITVTAVNDIPIIAGLDGDLRSYTEGDAAALLGSTSGITDVDSTDFNTGTLTVSFTAGSDVAEDVLGIRNEGTGAGQIGVSGANITFGGVTIGSWTGGSSGSNLVITFNANANATNTAALINNLTYFNTDSDNPTTTTRNIRVVLTDGDGGTSASNDTTMTVATANDAPVLDNSGTMTLTSITEDQTANSGQTVDSIVASAGGDRITDVDTAAVEGIAITATTNGNGSWEYSTNGGSTWQSVGTVSNTSALLLRSTDLLRFAPNAVDATNGDITFRAWDQTGTTLGYEETYVDVSTNGGTTPFSSATEVATINVTAVNQAPTFSTGNGRNYTSISGMQFGNAIAQQADGKYVMAGWSDSAGTRDFAVIRYNFDGSLDTTFGSGNGYVITAVGSGADEAQDIKVLASGKILVQGYAINGGSNDIAFVQYNSDGSLDTSFGGGTGKTMSGIAGEDTGYSMAVQSDGKILVGGTNGGDFLLARFNSNGSLDTGFGSSGIVTTDFASNSDTGRAIALQSDGKIVLAGQSYNNTTFTDYAVVRYNLDGTLDTTFNGNGKASIDFGSTTDQGYGIAIQNDGKILVNGFTNVNGTTDNGVIRLTSTGALDTTFNSTGRVVTAIGSGSDFAFDLKVQSDGKILSSGYASVSGSDFTVVRYNSNGSLDTTYGGTGIVVTNFNATTDDRGTKMFLQADGKVILAGCTTQSGTFDFALARYNADGTADVTFNTSNTLGGTISYTENGSAVVLDSNVQVFDEELTPLNNFSGATLTLARVGGANSQDVFSASGVLSTLTQGGNLVVSGTTIGTVTTNSSGTLVLTFNSNATQARVNSAMQAIAYSNSSDAPPSSVQIGWTLNDGNSGSQGTGGALTGTGTSTVTITALNDAPVLTATTINLTAITETSNSAPVGAVGTLVSSIVDFASPSGQLDNVTDADASPQLGIAVTSVDSNYGTWYYSLDNGSNWSLMGNVTTSAARLLAADASTRVYFQINTATEYWGSMGNAISFRAWDQTTGTNGAQASTTSNGGTTAFSSLIDSASMLVSAVNDAPRFLGSELITNGTFASNITGWTTSGTVDFNSASLRFGSGNTVGPHSASQTITTVAGQTYELVFDYRDGSTAANQSLVVTATGSSNLLTTPTIVSSVNGSSSVTYYYTFVANSTSTTITFTDTSDTSGLTNNGTTGVDGFLDNISVKLRDGNTGTLAYTENAGAQAIHSTLSLSDIDSTNLTGATISITSGFSSSQDTLAFTNQLGITGSYSSSTGVLTLSGTATVANYQTALRSITYANSSDAPTSARTISFSVTDGSLSNNAATRDIAITAVNDAPTLAPYSPTLPLTEDGSAYTALISSLLGSSISDPDSGAQQGIAINGLTLAGGTLEYSLDGTNWTVVSGVSSTNALLLRSTDQMRFTPSTANGGTTLISYNAWDRTSGTAGGFANVTTTGGTTAFSTATDTITVNVASVNDAPVLDNTGTMTLTTITEDDTSNAGQTVASIVSSAGGDRITDIDTSAIEGIAITATTNGNGSWEYSTNGGGNWSAVGTVSGSSALLLRSTDLLRFVPNGQNATTGDFTFRAWDQTSGAVGSKVDASTNGGTTAFSSATEVASITVTAVNDNIGTLSDVDGGTNTVAENATIGTTVGITALASDVDTGDTITYSLDFSAGGRYTINSSTGVVTVAGALNAESQFSETILVRATSSDGSAVTRGFVITVTSVNEAPNDIRIPITVASENFESGASGWSNNQTVNGGGTLTNYLGGWGNENGTTQIYKDFTLSGNQSSVTITFDMYELDSWDGEAFKVWIDGVQYSSQDLYMDAYGNFYLGRETELSISQQMTTGTSNLGGSATFEDEIHRYTFTVTSAATSIRLGFSSTADGPASDESWGVDNLTIVENRPNLSIAENSVNAATVGTVEGYDVDAASVLTYSLTDNAGGRFAINASTGEVSVADGSLLNYEAATSHNITVQVSDGNLTYSRTLTIQLTDVNEAPVLDNSGNTSLTSITEDQTENFGNTVASIIASAGGDRITDEDSGAIEGVAITSLTSGNGTWEYSVDGGNNWSAVGSVSNSSALLLRSIDYVRFVPNGQNATSADFTFRAWDQTSGSSGSKVDVSTNGGATAFSSATEVASITVTAVNDAPSITNAATYNFANDRRGYCVLAHFSVGYLDVDQLGRC